MPARMSSRPRSLLQLLTVQSARGSSGIREDDSLITKDTSRFLPHVVID
ncbi:glutathionylspermidine synthase family protein [Pseudomonas sp. v388]|nr:glutathionylspermidine synthase family protein [Pseudomonas sp. v388]